MRVLDAYFEALRSQDWAMLSGCLAEDVCRTGPYLDVVRGKQAYVEFLAGVIPRLRNYELRVRRVRRLDSNSALVELSEFVDVDDAPVEFPELLLFDFDASGSILRVDIYIKRLPGREPSGANS